ncbi:MAG: hypothetical protein ACRDF4_07070, partial [Rhabdochlamydiaceae bacterium]
SYFHVHFTDGSDRKEHDLNWTDVAEQAVVEFFGQQKVVFLSMHPVKRLKVVHNDLTTELEVGEEEKAYQAVVGSAMIRTDGSTQNRILGRIIGRVKDGIVIEERFLDGRTGEITGIKL